LASFSPRKFVLSQHAPTLTQESLQHGAMYRVWKKTHIHTQTGAKKHSNNKTGLASQAGVWCTKNCYTHTNDEKDKRTLFSQTKKVCPTRCYST
jgi:hypothetical protein